MLEKIRTHYLRSDSRTRLVGKNIVATFALKAWGGLLQFLMVPVTLGVMTQYEYGIWLMISNLLLWMDTMDIGLGNGLRNRLTEAIAREDWQRGRRLISTTLMMLVLIVLPMVVGLCIVIEHTDIFAFLNVDPTLVPNLREIAIISVILVGATFILKCIGNVYMALQLPAVSNAIIVLGQTLVFVLLLVLSLTTGLNMYGAVVIYTGAPLLVYIVSFPITFAKYPQLRPHIRLFDSGSIRSLFGIGIEFFVAQISNLFIFATSGLLISKLLSPSEVATFQIAYRYFGIQNILFTVISAPLWSATTDAYTRGDIAWIQQTMRTMRKILLLFGAITAVMFLVAEPVYRLWIGEEIHIPYDVSLYAALNVYVIIYSTCYSNMICGIGKIRLLMIISIISAALYIPLSLQLAALWGIAGILLAMIAVNLLSALSNHIQFRLLISGKARGIWNQ